MARVPPSPEVILLTTPVAQQKTRSSASPLSSPDIAVLSSSPKVRNVRRRAGASGHGSSEAMVCATEYVVLPNQGEATPLEPRQTGAKAPSAEDVCGEAIARPEGYSRPCPSQRKDDDDVILLSDDEDVKARVLSPARWLEPSEELRPGNLGANAAEVPVEPHLQERVRHIQEREPYFKERGPHIQERQPGLAGGDRGAGHAARAPVPHEAEVYVLPDSDEEAEPGGIPSPRGTGRNRRSMFTGADVQNRMRMEPAFGFQCEDKEMVLNDLSEEESPVEAESSPVEAGAARGYNSQWCDSQDEFWSAAASSQGLGTEREWTQGVLEDGAKDGVDSGEDDRKTKAPKRSRALTEEEKRAKEEEKTKEREEKARKKMEEKEAKKKQREEARTAKEQQKEQAALRKKLEKEAAAFERVKDSASRNTTVIDSRITGPLLTALTRTLGERNYPYTVEENRVQWSITWRMQILDRPDGSKLCAAHSSTLASSSNLASQAFSESQNGSQSQSFPFEMSQCQGGMGESQGPAPCPLCQQSQAETDGLNLQVVELPYTALLLDPEDFMRQVRQGTFEGRVRELQCRIPAGSSLGLLIPGLHKLVKKREQEAYSGKSTWETPDFRLALAKLVTHFSGVRSRACADQYEAAEHIAGLHRTLAEARYRPRLTRFHIMQNGGCVNKKDRFYEEIRYDTWRKVLIAIPGVAARDAIAISRAYPSLKALLCAYLSSELSEKEKQDLLQDLVKDSRFEESQGPEIVRRERVGPALSKRVYHALTATDSSSALSSKTQGLSQTQRDTE